MRAALRMLQAEVWSWAPNLLAAVSNRRSVALSLPTSNWAVTERDRGRNNGTEDGAQGHMSGCQASVREVRW